MGDKFLYFFINFAPEMASFLTKLVEMISPRVCAICGGRLMLEENSVCNDCLNDIPYTHYDQKPTDNYLARLFWKKFPIEKATALFYYHPHAEYVNIIYNMKYHNHPEICYDMGEYAAKWLLNKPYPTFFEGIDYLVPVPLAKNRLHERGYNQSELLAQGMENITRIPLLKHVVCRTDFKKSQTQLQVWERNENVENIFQLTNADWADKLSGKHILLIDDIITTGATICSCAQALSSIMDLKISVFSLGFAK